MSKNVYLRLAAAFLAQWKSVWTLVQWESPRSRSSCSRAPACGCRREFHRNFPPPPRRSNSWLGPGPGGLQWCFRHSHRRQSSISLRLALSVKTKMKKKKSRIAHDVVISDIPARPTKRIAKDLSDALRADSGSDSRRITSLRSGYRQGENQGAEKHCREEWENRCGAWKRNFRCRPATMYFVLLFQFIALGSYTYSPWSSAEPPPP